MKLFFRKRTCPVCKKHKFWENYEICPVCGWENDPVQRRDKDFAGGANKLSLREARKVYLEKITEKQDETE